MNDATPGIGAALGVAVLGSIAASQYSSEIGHSFGARLPPERREAITSSLPTAISAAGRLPAAQAESVIDSAPHAFVGSVHFAVTAAAVLVIASAAIMWRFLPRQAEDAVEPKEAESEPVGLRPRQL